MADVSIRPAAPEDVTAVLRVAERSWQRAYGGFLPERAIDAAMEEWYDADRTRAAVDREDVSFFVAERDGDVVGFVRGRPSEGEQVVTLGALYVEPERWGAGIGSALLDEFETYWSERGFEQASFRVLAENRVGTSFYRKHGYEAVDETEADLFGETVEERRFRGSIQ